MCDVHFQYVSLEKVQQICIGKMGQKCENIKIILEMMYFFGKIYCNRYIIVVR